MYKSLYLVLNMSKVLVFTVFVVGLWHGASEASLCTARGRFPNENIADCRGYTMCLSGAPGVFTQYDLSCPDNFVYSHIENQCTNITSYQCYPHYNCTSEGNFDDKNDPNCTTYVACIHGLSGIATARLLECPENTLYSPLDEACVNSTQFTCGKLPSAVPAQESTDPKTNNAHRLCDVRSLLVYLMLSLLI